MLLAACGAAGTQPHDMSAGQHHAAAEVLETASEEHAHRTDPGGGTICGGSATQGSSPCWSTPSNQAAHQQEAQRLHELAERHRAAGHALVQAEFDACSGFSASEREASPFFHRDEIASVSALREFKADAVVSGAVIRFRSLEGLTLGWLGRAVRCHVALAAALGHPAELAYCPLAVRGVSAEVSASASGLEVAVWSTDPAGGAEILWRAQKLLPNAGSR
jgi:hypothetical protein